MKAIILGGCGFVGSSIARDLFKNDGVSVIRLADINPNPKRLAASVRSSPKVSLEYIDITRDFSGLVRAIKGNNLVINCVGPYQKFGLNALKAAIRAQVDYVDVCDDLATTRQFYELDTAARKAGVCLCTGLGSVPGLTNIMARFGAGKMSRIDEIDVFFLIALINPIGKGGLSGAISQFQGNVSQFIDGRLVDVPGGSGAEETEFLPPFGRTTVYYARHPEPFTFPRYFRTVKKVVNKAAFYPASTVALFTELLRIGLCDEQPVPVGNTSVSPRDFITSFLKQRSDLRTGEKLNASLAINVTLRGQADGAKASLTYRTVNWGGPITAIPASIAARMIGSGRSRAPGVVAPEAIINPRAFLKELKAKGIHVFEDKTVEKEIRG